MSELYTKEILRLTTQIPHQAPLANPHISVQKTSRICGSRIRVDAHLDVNAAGDKIITGFYQMVKACALGQAAASLWGQRVIGLSQKEYHAIAPAYRTMVQTGVMNPSAADHEKWADLAILAPVHDHPGRHGSVLLPLDCLDVVFADT